MQRELHAAPIQNAYSRQDCPISPASGLPGLVEQRFARWKFSYATTKRVSLKKIAMQQSITAVWNFRSHGVQGAETREYVRERASHLIVAEIPGMQRMNSGGQSGA